MRPPALKYLMQELKFTTSEWTQLSDKDREELKQYATEEMDALGL